jgi:hypothetical protein
MRKKIIIGTIGIELFLATIGIFFVIKHAKKSTPQKENRSQSIKVVNVEKVIGSPKAYKGFLE